MPVVHLAKFRRNKFGNVWTTYKGVKYQSRREASFAGELDLLIAAGQIASWRRQVRIALIVGDRKISTIVVDFEITHLDGTLEFVEVKGHETLDWQLKWSLYDALYPQVKKRIVR